MRLKRDSTSYIAGDKFGYLKNNKLSDIRPETLRKYMELAEKSLRPYFPDIKESFLISSAKNAVCIDYCKRTYESACGSQD